MYTIQFCPVIKEQRLEREKLQILRRRKVLPPFGGKNVLLSAGDTEQN